MDNTRKLCIFCKHFRWDQGYGDLSDITPGADASMWCSLNLFNGLYGYDITRDAYRNAIFAAQACGRFDPLDDERVRSYLAARSA